MTRHSWTDASYQTECPMPDCTQPLALVYELYREVSPGLMTGAEEPGMTQPDARTWKVECLADHVVLVPLEAPDCGCGEAPEKGIGDPGADHDVHYAESEECRHFTAKDVDRLRDLIRRLTA